MHFSTVLSGAALVIAVSAFEYPDFVPLHKRQEPGTPAYDCHANCGGVIVSGRTEGYCDSTTYQSELEACRECALEYDIWKYYGNSVTKAAEACGDDYEPYAASETTAAAETTAAPESTTSALETTAAPESTTSAPETTSTPDSTVAPGTTAQPETSAAATVSSASETESAVVSSSVVEATATAEPTSTLSTSIVSSSALTTFAATTGNATSSGSANKTVSSDSAPTSSVAVFTGGASNFAASFGTCVVAGALAIAFGL